jgi:Lyase/Adenylosuccinate lyase C-terminus
MAGRSHGVQALPITFGHKAAIWLSEMGRNYRRMRDLEPRTFVGGMVGAVGTQASYGPKAPELERRLMKRLGLGVADINWQPARDRFAEYVCVLAIIGQTLGKIANEIINLEHTEIGEVFEPFSEGKVGSSTMPHKRNPSSCEAVVGVSRGLRYNAAFMLECMMVEHERDGSAWRGEWKALPESCLMAGGLLAAMNYVLSGLHVDAGRMRKNLDLLGGFLLSERVMFALSEKVGKQTAHDLVYEASMHGIEDGISFEQALMQDPRVARALTPEELRNALDPTTYVDPGRGAGGAVPVRGGPPGRSARRLRDRAPRRRHGRRPHDRLRPRRRGGGADLSPTPPRERSAGPRARRPATLPRPDRPRSESHARCPARAPHALASPPAPGREPARPEPGPPGAPRRATRAAPVPGRAAAAPDAGLPGPARRMRPRVVPSNPEREPCDP